MSLLVGAASNGPSGYFLTDSLRFRRSATAYLQRTPSSAGNRRTYTYSCWVKKSFIPENVSPYPSQQLLFANDNASSANTNTAIQFLPTNTIRFVEQISGGAPNPEYYLTSTQLFRDTSAWYHVVVAYDTTQSTASDRIKIYINGTQITAFDSSAYPTLNFEGNVNKTCIHNIGSDVVSGVNGTLDGYMTEINFVDGTALAPTDFGETDDNGTWIPKKYTGTYGTNGFYLPFKNNSSATFVNTFNGSSQSLSVIGSSDMALGTGDCTVECYFKVDSLINYRSIIDNRDAASSSNGFSIDIDANGSIYNYSNGFIVQSANGVISAGQYYHVAYTRASGTHRLFVDGVQVATSTTSRDYTNDDIFIGRAPYGGEWFDGEISNVRIVKGTAVYTSNFTPSETNLTAVTNTKLLTCQSASIVDNSGESQTIVNEGTVAASTGNPFRTLSVTSDQSGNINNWVSNNINLDSSGDATYDLMPDVPTLTNEDTNNFATLNPNNMAVNTTMTDGNLKASNSVNHATMFPTNMPTTGKYYFECKMAVNAVLGLGFRTDTNKVESAYSDEANKYYFYLNDSNAYRIVETTNTALGANLNSTSSTFQVAIDFDAAKYYFGVNNTWYAADWGTDGDPASGTNPSYDLTDGTKMFPFVYVAGGTWTVNFGQQSFNYTPPTGFKKINAYNLPDSTIEDGSNYFDTTLYTGNGSTQSITGLEFQPDFLWLKARTGASYSHHLVDAVRGNNKFLMSNRTDAEQTSTDQVTAFTSDGFTLGADSAGPNDREVNENSRPMVAWCWDANGAGSSNGDGSITSTVSANTTAGFSIATYTEPSSGTYTVGHGLGVVPSMIILKPRSASGENWIVYHKDLGSVPTTHGLYLNSTAAKFTSGSNWLTENTTARFGVTVGQVTPGSTTMVAYSFAEVEGYSKFGSYTGNGSADGPFTYTGFSPSWIMMKDTDTGDWLIYDTSRNLYNLSGSYLQPNNADAEGTESNGIDILSNGFKQRNTFSNLNASGNTYIYMAFAENPFKNSIAR